MCKGDISIIELISITTHLDGVGVANFSLILFCQFQSYVYLALKTTQYGGSGQCLCMRCVGARDPEAIVGKLVRFFLNLGTIVGQYVVKRVHKFAYKNKV